MNRSALFAIIGAAIFLLSAGSAFAQTPTSGTVHIQPNPTLDTNITWSSFNSTWTNPLEYQSGSTQGNTSVLNASLSNAYANPITVNPEYLQTGLPSTYDKINLFNKSLWITGGEGVPSGTILQLTNTTHSITYNVNESDSIALSNTVTITIPITDLPSNNPAYDYFTIGGNITSYTGMEFAPALKNSTTGTQITAVNDTPKTIYHGTNGIPGGEPELTSPFWYTESLKEANLTIGTSSIRMGFEYTLPQTTADQVFSATINNIGITERPLTLGTATLNGTQTTVTAVQGNAHLQTFNPDFSWTAITNGGYTAAVSQQMQNLTTQQNAISSGNYIEQVEYQGQFDLPTAPDLSYGATDLAEQFNVSTSQTQVLDINGVSYLSQISGKNGTVQLLSSVNPNQPTQFLQIVDFTQSQWNSISVSPGIFSIAGIEYYWWIAVGGLATLIGLAAAAKHAGTKADQDRIRRGR